MPHPFPLQAYLQNVNLMESTASLRIPSWFWSFPAIVHFNGIIVWTEKRREGVEGNRHYSVCMLHLRSINNMFFNYFKL